MKQALLKKIIEALLKIILDLLDDGAINNSQK